MKPVHLAVLGAVVAVVAVVFVLLEDDSGHGAGRRRATRDSSRPGAPGGTAAPHLRPPAGDRDLGSLRRGAGVVVRGHVYDLRKNPVPGAFVEAIAAELDANWMAFAARLSLPEPVAARALAGADGAYELLLPGKGRYALRAGAPGFGVSAEGGRPMEEETGGIDFYLLEGRPVNGRVVNESQDPVPGARVVAAAFTSFDMRTQGGPPKAETVTADDGSFTISVPPGKRLNLAVQAAGYAPYADARFQPTGREITIILERGVALRLRAVAKESQAPLEGVQVTVTHQSGFTRSETGEGGELALPNLPAPKTRASGYSAFLGGPGYVPQRLALRASDIVDGLLDLGDVEVEAGGVVRGRVLDRQTGSAIAGARVRPFGGRSFQLMLMFACEALSGEDGSYELEGVPLDAGTMIAVCDDYVMAMDQVELFSYLRRSGKGLFAEGSRDAELDIELVKAQGLGGVVLGPDSSPVAGARVQRPFRARGGFSRMLGGGEPLAFSDTRGRFSLRGFKQGEVVRLVATHREYGASAEVSVAAGGGEELTLHLEPPLVLLGVVADDVRRPIEGVRVSVGPKVQGGSARSVPAPGGATRPGLTDAQGRYVIRNAPSGELTLTFDHRDYAVFIQEIAVDAGSGETDLGTTILSRGNGVEGVVVDARGAPLSGIGVNAGWAGRPMGFGNQAQGRTWGSHVTDESGRFAIYGLRAGRYRLMVTGSEFGDRPVVDTGARDVRIVVRPAATMRGRVTANGAPVEAAWVRAELAGFEGEEGSVDWGARISSARTDKQGNFVLSRLPPDATFNVTITHNRYRPRTVKGVAAAQEGREFTLDAGVRVAGTVAEPDGKAVVGATLRLLIDGRPVKWGRTDESGRFEFGGLGAGSLEIEMIASPEGHMKSDPIAVKGGDLAVRIVVERGETIRGKLVGGGDQRGYRIEAVDSEGKLAASAWAWRGREFALRGLAKGSYAVRVLSSAGAASTVVAEVEGVATGTKDLEIELGD